MTGVINDVRIFYQDEIPEFVVMKRYIKSKIIYYMNNGHIEVRDKIDEHIIEKEEMTQETINCLKKRFERNRKMFQQTELECARIREYERRTICDK